MKSEAVVAILAAQVAVSCQQRHFIFVFPFFFLNSLILKYQVINSLFQGPTNKISTENRQSK